jgi:hypothetical protein
VFTIEAKANGVPDGSSRSWKKPGARSQNAKPVVSVGFHPTAAHTAMNNDGAAWSRLLASGVKLADTRMVNILGTFSCDLL